MPHILDFYPQNTTPHRTRGAAHLSREPETASDLSCAAARALISSPPHLVDLGGPVVREAGQDGGHPERSHAAALCVALLRARDEASDVLCRFSVPLSSRSSFVQSFRDGEQSRAGPQNTSRPNATGPGSA